MADFELVVGGVEVRPWLDPPNTDQSSRLNPCAGAPEGRLVATVGQLVTLTAKVAGVLGPIDTALGGRLFVAASSEQAHPWAVSWETPPAGQSSVQRFYPQRPGHYLVYLRRPGGGAVSVHIDAEAA